MRIPAEWEPQGFVQLTWPHADTDWYDLPHVLDCYVQVARSIVKYEPLLVVCRDREECVADMAARGFTPGPSVRLVECPLNDTWARDHGGISVLDGPRKRVLDFVFNGWGLKFGSDLDNQITRRIYEAGVFAPDVELCDMAGDGYEKAHFEERISDTDVVFDYRIKPGPATTRNAIHLLKLMGFDNDIVTAAHDRADRYVKTGKWE